MQTKLYRSRTNQMLGGVCGGLARHFNMDLSWVRIIFLLLAAANGVGIWLYIALWLLLPLEGAEATGVDANVRAGGAEIRERLGGLVRQAGRAVGRTDPQTSLILGGLLLVAGGLMLLRRLGFMRWLSLGQLWPLLVIAAGVWLLARYIRER